MLTRYPSRLFELARSLVVMKRCHMVGRTEIELGRSYVGEIMYQQTEWDHDVRGKMKDEDHEMRWCTV